MSGSSTAGKLEVTGLEGKGPVKDETPLKEVSCVVCGVVDGLKSCGGCMSTHYCSEACQKSHWSHHAVYCRAVCDLEKLERQKRYKGKSVRLVQVDDKVRRKVLKLVGNKPKVKCFFDGKESEWLWDTGSMVSIADRRWVKESFPEKEILPVSMFMDEQLRLKAANSSEIKFDGVILLDLGLEEGKVEFAVPVLVSSAPIAEPILGFNVIEDVVVNAS